MPSLTSLPLSLLSRILAHLCDLEGLKSRAKLHLTNDYIPNRHPAVRISLDGVRTVNAPFPRELLAPALASPVLAAAAERLPFVDERLVYLTDLNTEAHLSCWVDAFSEYVQAIAIIDAGKKWRDGLSQDLRKRMEEKLCCDAVDLFRTICVKDIKLKVLDIVNVPFDRCGSMEDEMMTGLCTTLETCQSTLQELALPVYTKADMCTRALATVTLPHLTVFSIELRDTRKLRRPTQDQIMNAGRQFLYMMQSVDAHADRQKGLTSINELRLINLYGVPCTMAKDSGCSAGFFRAIKTLRVTRNCPILSCPNYDETLFGSLFKELEYFYRAGSPPCDITFLKFCKRLKEVHLCHHISRTGERVIYDRNSSVSSYHVFDAVYASRTKIRTLVADRLYSHHVRAIQKHCPNLQHLSLHVAAANMNAFGGVLKTCTRLATLEIIVIAKYRGRRMGKKEWLELGRLISGNTKLRELEIQMGVLRGRKAVPIYVLVDCLVGIIKRIGRDLGRLLLRLRTKLKTPTQALDALCRIMDCCADHSRVLRHLDVDIIQGGQYCRSLPVEEFVDMLEAPARLKLSREKLVESQPYLNKIDLGTWHRFFHDFKETEMGESL